MKIEVYKQYRTSQDDYTKWIVIDDKFEYVKITKRHEWQKYDGREIEEKAHDVIKYKDLTEEELFTELL